MHVRKAVLIVCELNRDKSHNKPNKILFEQITKGNMKLVEDTVVEIVSMKPRKVIRNIGA